MDSPPLLLSRAMVSWLPVQRAYERECPKTSRLAPNATLISGTVFSTRRTRLQPHIPFCTENGRILLANLLQRSRSTFSWGSFLSFFAFKEGILDTQISALGG